MYRRHDSCPRPEGGAVRRAAIVVAVLGGTSYIAGIVRSWGTSLPLNIRDENRGKEIRHPTGFAGFCYPTPSNALGSLLLRLAKELLGSSRGVAQLSMRVQMA